MSIRAIERRADEMPTHNEAVNCENECAITRTDRLYRGWQYECECLPEDARQTFAEYLAEAIDADQYVHDEFAPTDLPPREELYEHWTEIPY